MYDEEAGDERFRIDHQCSRENFISCPVQTRSYERLWEKPPPIPQKHLPQPPEMPITPSRHGLLSMHLDVQRDGSVKAYSEQLARIRFRHGAFYDGGRSHSFETSQRSYYGSPSVFDPIS